MSFSAHHLPAIVLVFSGLSVSLFAQSTTKQTSKISLSHNPRPTPKLQRWRNCANLSLRPRELNFAASPKYKRVRLN